MRATHKAVQTQTVKHPLGNEVEVTITQLFSYDPGVHTYRNGDPGYPPSFDECGKAQVVYTDNGDTANEPWVDKAIDWQKFNDETLIEIETA